MSNNNSQTLYPIGRHHPKSGGYHQRGVELVSLFYSVIFLQIIFLSSLIIYLYYTTHLVLCQVFIIAFIRRSGKESNPTQLMVINVTTRL